jgi:RNA polymerase sigma-70 factor (ECF subfamily)
MYGSARATSETGEEDTSGSGAPETLCLDTLYREESPRLLRSLSRRTSNNEEARDLLQEIFCRLARLRADGPLRLERPHAYLSRIATNLLRDRGKRALRQMSGNHVSADEAVLPGIDQQRLLESRDMLTRVEAAMLKLRPKTREIFMAHRIDGLSYAEIAERTGLSIKGVEKQMSKAIAKIDRMLDRD